MKVSVWHGTGAHTFHRRYEPGDPIERAYDYDIDHPASTPETLAEQAFAMFNGQPATPSERRHTTRYYNAGNRSLSVGDVVVIGELALACDRTGLQPVAIPPDDT